MSDFFEPTSKPTFGNLRVGDTKSDDPNIIDRDFGIVSGPPDIPKRPIEGMALSAPKKVTRMLSGTELIDPAYTLPTCLLPADFARKSLTLLVTSPDSSKVAESSASYSGGAAATQAIPLGAALLGFRINFDAGSAQANSQVIFTGAATGSFSYDFTVSATATTVVTDSFPIPILPAVGQQITANLFSIATGGPYTVDMYYTLPMSNYILVADDPGKLQVDPNVGAIPRSAAGRLYANNGDQGIDLSGHTGAVFVSAAGSFAACSVSYWSVTE